MPQLNLPLATLKIRKSENQQQVFDVFRNTFINLTPEEWVRQQLLHYLVDKLQYPQNLISVEKSIDVNGQLRRYDAVIYSRITKPIMVIECKAPNIKLTQDVFDQIHAYNQSLKVDFLLISNGMQHYCIKMDESSWNFMDKIPKYSQL